jgi:hypothetical protein
MKNIKISLSESSIKDAIRQLTEYKAWIEKKTALLAEKLALIGAREASIRFTTAMYDGNNDVSITVDPIENGWAIKAQGEAVCFIEFGAGVYHNPSEPYPSPRPDGVVGIGEYGKGFGKRQAWGFYDDADQLVITRGTPAAMPMYYATKEMMDTYKQIAMEVFGSND